MNEFFNSKFIKDLEQGTFATVPISIEIESILMLCIGLLLTLIIATIIYFVIKKNA